jgi:hypothetical protein
MASDRSPPAAAADDWPYLRCERCSGRIGVYEPLWWQLADGSMVPSAFLPMSLSSYALRLGSRFYHRACLPPE